MEKIRFAYGNFRYLVFEFNYKLAFLSTCVSHYIG